MVTRTRIFFGRWFARRFARESVGSGDCPSRASNPATEMGLRYGWDAAGGAVTARRRRQKATQPAAARAQAPSAAAGSGTGEKPSTMLLPDCDSAKVPGAAKPVESTANTAGLNPVTLVAVAIVHW